MSNPPEWLPDLVYLEDYGGNWEQYVEAVYAFFKEDFIDSGVAFDKKAIRIMREPLLYGKETTFWHITSEGMEEMERSPDLRRCERIRWPRPIIENHSDDAIKCWRNERRWKRKNGERISKRIIFWFCDEDYIVVLAEEKSYLLIVTAYCVTYAHKRRKLQTEYEDCIKRKKSPF